MSISPYYFRYLDFFGEAVPVRDFRARPDAPALCALRHDVDHDLDLALEMAHWEHARGARATYYILPNADYWNQDPRLVEKCLQLQDYGHEIGLHVNGMAEWVSGQIDDVHESLAGHLRKLRDAGVVIDGIAAHGDKRCYEFNVSNYWCFAELRPDDPKAAENGRTAEGPFESDGRPRLRYPDSHRVVRADGRSMDLWSVRMDSLGIAYHAWHVPSDRYFSDSGGGWLRSPDPLTQERRAQRWQVLMHPEHWRGEKKYYFFLSSARSGSRWLSEVLAAGTPLKTRHEYILNQPFHEGKTGRKDTSDVWALEDAPETVNQRLMQAWEEFEGQPRDLAEVNVYLEDFIEPLKGVFPKGRFIHLRRDPALVVGSLMDRDWYDTPADRKHPRLAGAAGLTQFERCCHYIVQVDARLRAACEASMGLSDLTASAEGLARALAELGIPYHPRLGAEVAGRVSNARAKKAFPSPEQWSEEYRSAFASIFDGAAASVREHGASHAPRQSLKDRLLRPRQPSFVLDGSRQSLKTLYANCARLEPGEETERLRIVPVDRKTHAYVSLWGCSWRKAGHGWFQVFLKGWPVERSEYFECALRAKVPEGRTVALNAISYTDKGKFLHRRVLGQLDSNNPELRASFTLHPGAALFDLFIYLPAADSMDAVIVELFEIFRRRA